MPTGTLKTLVIGGTVACSAALMMPVGRAAVDVALDQATAHGLCVASYPGVAGADPLSACQWDMAAIEATAANTRARGAGVRVGVLDSGVDFTHPDLAGAIDVTN